MSKYLQIIEEVAEKALNQSQSFSENKSYFGGGHNGPYFDLETSIRNTAHWLVSYSVLFRATGYKPFSEIAEKLLNFILDAGVYEKNGVFVHRQKAGKDWCNGVIGQAWVIEALAVSGKLLGRDDALRKAAEIAAAFKFSASVSAWKRTDPRNGKNQIDYTLNHQLWYAASLAMLNDEKLDRQVKLFLDSMNSGGFKVRETGCINHLLFANSAKSWLLRFRYQLSEYRNPVSVREKEVGYHLYNLHPLARLKMKFCDHAFFSSANFNAALDFACNEHIFASLDNNKYAYPYNAPAFEYPMITGVFNFEPKLSEKAWEIQIEKTYDEKLSAFHSNCPDPLTLNARVYEYLLSFFYQKYN